MSNKIFETWLNHERVSKELKQEMQLMSDEEKSVAFNEAQIAFGTAGYRAKMGPGNHYLNEITYQQLSEGYARFLVNKYPKKRKALVVHDNRRNAQLFTMVAAYTLAAHGIEVYLVENNDLLPTPIASYLIPRLGCAGAINVTASHNPKEYNGFKCYDDTGCQLLPDDAKNIVEYMPSWSEIMDKPLVKNDEMIKYIDPKMIDQYFTDITKTLVHTNPSVKKNIKLVYSAMHGTASNYMSKFLNGLGYECIDVKEQNFPNSDFINTPLCNPEDPKALTLATSIADQNKVNLVLASDPDADRLAIALKKDGKWIFLNGNQAGIIETYYRFNVLKNDYRIPVAISTYISTNLIDRIAKDFKGKIIRTATGFKWVGDQINKLSKKEVYVNGFEEAIGALPSDLNRDKDSFQTAALILEIINFYQDKNWDLIDILEKEIYPKYGHWYGNTTS